MLSAYSVRVHCILSACLLRALYVLSKCLLLWRIAVRATTPKIKTMRLQLTDVAEDALADRSFEPFVECHATPQRSFPARIPAPWTNLEGMPDIFGVISDATRRDILQVLLERHQQDAEISVSEIVARLELSQPTVSKHLKVLREAELVTVREEGQHRYYTLEPEPLEMIEDFVIPFLSVGFDTEVTVQYVSETGELMPDPEAPLSDEEVLSQELASAAGNLGRAVANAEHRVKELVARFRLRA